MSEQQENLDRVALRIAPAVMDFCREHRRFFAEELREYVTRETGVAAPGSADRILRHLRQTKRLNYQVLSRHESLYEVLWVDSEEAAYDQRGVASVPVLRTSV